MSKKLPKQPKNPRPTPPAGKPKKPKLPLLPNAKPGRNTMTPMPYRAGMNSGYKGM